MTNFERIKNMSVEELAQLFSEHITICGSCPIKEKCYPPGVNYTEAWEQWLKREVEE